MYLFSSNSLGQAFYIISCLQDNHITKTWGIFHGKVKIILPIGQNTLLQSNDNVLNLTRDGSHKTPLIKNVWQDSQNVWIWMITEQLIGIYVYLKIWNCAWPKSNVNIILIDSYTAELKEQIFMRSKMNFNFVMDLLKLWKI